MPNGMSFSGYCCEDKANGVYNIILFREAAESDTYTFELPNDISNLKAEKIYQNADCEYTVSGNKITIEFSSKRAFVWLRFS